MSKAVVDTLIIRTVNTVKMALLFCPALSPLFYALYIAAGFTDMIDGMVARKTNTVSEFGSKLDTMADFVLVVVCLIKLIPILNITIWVYVWVVIIAFIKVINVVSGYVVQKKFVAAHTVMNKVTGAVLFIFPLTLLIIELKYSAVVVCLFATFAAVQEGHYIRTGREV
ncbi:MAG: CDP-alcohol phosphatidyltransferase family protein [Lachnospiraceae bacterium]|nr:CDP-alcohol phosphatidyltransferase family protein [Lachnospiraceae bacterium]